MHKKIQSKAFSEVEEFFAGLSDPMTSQDALKLPYVEMVIKETMRLFPAGSMLGRKSSADVQLGLKLPTA
jgi:cytochrome P450